MSLIKNISAEMQSRKSLLIDKFKKLLTRLFKSQKLLLFLNPITILPFFKMFHIDKTETMSKTSRI